MNNQGKNPEEILEQAVAAMRSDTPETDVIRRAAECVWQNLSDAHQNGDLASVNAIRGCNDIRALLPALHKGELSSARALLVEDHLRECVDCRRESEHARLSPATQPWSQELPKPTFRIAQWAMVAAALLVIGISGYFIGAKLFGPPAGSRARVDRIDGALYLVRTGSERPLKVGDEIGEGDEVRTASLSRAVLHLRDGSLVEMNERAEFGVSMGYRDTTVHLDRGNIIVQAAKRKNGHLYVAARDCRVAVTGTVFSVNSGIKGSRVSVIEGEVRVAHDGATSILHPGDQMVTSAAMSQVPVRQEIAWSQDLDKHLALLAELKHLQNKLAGIPLPGLRYESRLLPLLPKSTVVYASIPNLGDAMQQASQLFQQELQESPVLRDWWTQAQSQNHGASFNDVVDELHSLSQYLGDEGVFSVSMEGKNAYPLAIAKIERSGLKEFLREEIARHDETGHSDIQVVDEQELAGATSQNRRGLWVLVRPDYLVVACELPTLQQFDRMLNQGSGGFATTPFGQRVNAAYQDGVGMLFAADLQRIAGDHVTVYAHQSGRPDTRRTLQQTGLADVQYVIAERKDNNGETLNRAELTFSHRRRGLASWLAAPAPIGGLDFVSKDAGAVGAFAVKNPADMLDDIFRIAYTSRMGGRSDLDKVQAELGINLKDDLASTLGGEVTFALDGPVLPTPSWKLVVEVYDPQRLQGTLQQLVADLNQHLQENGNKVTMESQSTDGLTYYTLHFVGTKQAVEVDFTFADGYMIVAPSRALVMDAIRIHQSGNSLSRSADFRALMPQDRHTNVSGLLYQNLGPVIGPIAQQLSASQLQAFQKLAAENKPSVVCAYGEDNDIRIVSNSKFFGLDLNTAVLSALMNIVQPSAHHAGMM